MLLILRLLKNFRALVMPDIKPLLRRINNTPAKLFAGALAVAALVYSVQPLWAGPTPADLSESPFALTSHMLEEWEEGDLIVFVRHLERCSRVDAACMDDEPSGITQRSITLGLEMRAQFAGLGLTATDVYSSPLTRTSQTSTLLFAEPTANEDFLYQCTDDFVQNALAKKIPGRNLVLVTHSSCLDEVNETFAYAEVDYKYGAAVILNVESVTEKNILGFIDADDWLKTLTPRS